MSSSSRVRGPGGISGYAWDCDSVPVDQPPLPSVQTPRSWEGTLGGTQEVWADPGSPRTRGLAEMSSDSAAPQVARLPRAPRRVPAGVLACRAPSSTARGEASGPPTPFPARRERFCACVRERGGHAAARWAPALRGARPARLGPFHVAPTWSRLHRRAVGPGRVHIWAHGHVLLTAAFPVKKVCAHLVGRFQLLLVNSFSVSQ